MTPLGEGASPGDPAPLQPAGRRARRVSPTRTSRAATAVLVAAAAVLAAPGATAATRGPPEPAAVPVGTVAEYPDGTFLEGVAVGADGAAYVTVALEARIDRVTPTGDVSTFAQFPALGDGSLGFPPAGPSSGDRTSLYVVTDGGLFGRLIDADAPAAPPGVFRLDVGIPGLPMPGTSPVHRR